MVSTRLSKKRNDITHAYKVNSHGNKGKKAVILKEYSDPNYPRNLEGNIDWN